MGTNAEGNNINVEYEAGSGIGFVIKNQDDLNAAIRKATEDGAIAAATKKPSLLILLHLPLPPPLTCHRQLPLPSLLQLFLYQVMEPQLHPHSLFQIPMLCLPMEEDVLQ